jgi:hypothetical protein
MLCLHAKFPKVLAFSPARYRVAAVWSMAHKSGGGRCRKNRCGLSLRFGVLAVKASITILVDLSVMALTLHLHGGRHLDSGPLPG